MRGVCVGAFGPVRVSPVELGEKDFERPNVIVLRDAEIEPEKLPDLLPTSAESDWERTLDSERDRVLTDTEMLLLLLCSAEKDGSETLSDMLAVGLDDESLHVEDIEAVPEIVHIEESEAVLPSTDRLVDVDDTTEKDRVALRLPRLPLSDCENEYVNSADSVACEREGCFRFVKKDCETEIDDESVAVRVLDIDSPFREKVPVSDRRALSVPEKLRRIGALSEPDFEAVELMEEDGSWLADASERDTAADCEGLLEAVRVIVGSSDSEPPLRD